MKESECGRYFKIDINTPGNHSLVGVGAAMAALIAEQAEIDGMDCKFNKDVLVIRFDNSEILEKFIRHAWSFDPTNGLWRFPFFNLEDSRRAFIQTCIKNAFFSNSNSSPFVFHRKTKVSHNVGTNDAEEPDDNYFDHYIVDDVDGIQIKVGYSAVESFSSVLDNRVCGIWKNKVELTKAYMPGATRIYINDGNSAIVVDGSMALALTLAPLGCYYLRASGKTICVAPRVSSIEDFVSRRPHVQFSLCSASINDPSEISYTSNRSYLPPGFNISSSYKLEEALLQRFDEDEVAEIFCLEQVKWDKNNKCVSSVIKPKIIPDALCNQVGILWKCFPNRAVAKKSGKDGFIAVGHSFRYKSISNIISGRPWFEGVERSFEKEFGNDSDIGYNNQKLRKGLEKVMEEIGLGDDQFDNYFLKVMDDVRFAAYRKFVTDMVAAGGSREDGIDRFNRFKDKTILSLAKGTLTKGLCADRLRNLFATYKPRIDRSDFWQRIDAKKPDHWQCIILLSLLTFGRRAEDANASTEDLQDPIT